MKYQMKKLSKLYSFMEVESSQMIKLKRLLIILFFRPKPEIRKQLSELKEGDHDGLNSILDKITINDYETFFLQGKVLLILMIKMYNVN
mgnify:CR=1 FL=1